MRHDQGLCHAARHKPSENGSWERGPPDPIAVILECARLAHEPIDHMPVVNPVVPLAAKSRNPVNGPPGEPDLQFFGVEPNVDPLADKATID